MLYFVLWIVRFIRQNYPHLWFSFELDITERGELSQASKIQWGNTREIENSAAVLFRQKPRMTSEGSWPRLNVHLDVILIWHGEESFSAVFTHLELNVSAYNILHHFTSIVASQYVYAMYFHFPWIWSLFKHTHEYACLIVFSSMSCNVADINPWTYRPLTTWLYKRTSRVRWCQEGDHLLASRQHLMPVSAPRLTPPAVGCLLFTPYLYVLKQLQLSLIHRQLRTNAPF